MTTSAGVTQHTDMSAEGSRGIEADLDVIREYFDRKLAQHGPDGPNALSWSTKQSQESRFAVLAEVGKLDGASLLDVGCGLGDFYGYLVWNKVALREYLGIDINAGMIEAARNKHPKAAFSVCDLLTRPLEERSYDYVVGSGTFAIEIPHWREVTRGLLKEMLRTCRRGVAVNFLSDLSDKRNPQSHYADPAEVVRFVTEELSRRFVLRHDYRTNDFTVFIYR